VHYLKNTLLIFFLATVAIIESVWILKSNGFYFIDECSHYLYSRFVLQALPITVETWHRPIPQWLFAIPAQLGHSFTMFFACGLFLCLLLLTYRIAVLHGIKHAEWVVILVGLQPTLFDISYACMTELPAACMMVLSYWYHLKGKHGWSLLIASLVIMCRSEMYVFAVFMFLLYASKREWKILPLVFVGPFLWIGSTTIISGNIMTFFNEWTRFSNIGKFIPGVSVTHYLENLHTTFGFAQVILFAAGIIVIARAKRNADFGILYATVAITIILHTIAAAEIFHWTGSIGELRYISVAGPFFGIVSVQGLSEILDKLKSSGGRFAFSILVFGVVVFNCSLMTHPRRWPNYEQIVLTITKNLKTEYPDKTLLSNNYAAAYVMDVAPSGGFHFAPINAKTVKKYSECLILWDPFSSNSIFSQTELTKENLLKDTTVCVLERYNYWNAEYLVLYKH
jgi:hypothetical protein